MSIRPGAAGRAVLLRSRADRASPAALWTLAVAVGVLSGSVPAGLTDRVDGSGILIGVSAALLGTAAVSPLVLTYLVVTQFGGAEETGRLRDLYLQHVQAWIPRAGAVLAATRDWLSFTVAACLTGGLIALGDSLRINDGTGVWGRWTANPPAVIAAELYILLLAILWGTVFHNPSAALLCAAVLPVLALAVLPLATEPWLLGLVKGTPLAPLWASTSGTAFGRYDLTMSDTTRNIALGTWTALAVLGTWLASRHNRAAVSQSHSETWRRGSPVSTVSPESGQPAAPHGR